MSADSLPSHRTARIAWWSALALALAFACGHAAMVARYLERVNRETFQQESPALATMRDISLGVAADARTWLRLTEERIERGDWRFSVTQIDGGSEGREVLWHPAWSWFLEALGRLRASVSGETLSEAIEAASFWAQLPLWIVMIVGGGWWVLRRWGYGAATLFVLTLASHRGLYVACYPGYPDHHGAIVATALAVVLGLFANGFGPANRAGLGAAGIWISAMAGAAGLALSAASLAPVLAGLGAAIFFCRNPARRAFGEEATHLVAAQWRRWGRVGAAAALGFYILEFVPDRLGWRLEVNHPVYALAWWGGGEFLAWWWKRSASTEATSLRRDWALPSAAVLALSAPVWVVAWGRGAVFAPLDDFVAGVHRHITEFYPLWKVSGSSRWLLMLSLLPLCLVPWAWRRLAEAQRVTLLGLTLLTGGLLGLALLQHRWWSLAAVAQAPLAALVGSAFIRRPRGRVSGAVLALLVVVSLPGPVMLLVEQWRVARTKDVQAADAMQLLYRDIGAALVASADGRDIVLLAPPEASTGVGYYGNLKTPGTLYWENRDGLRIAARILTATEDAEAARELSAAGVTHLLAIDPGDFTAQYADALANNGGRTSELGRMLGRRLLEGRDIPAWARALPYAVPAQFARMQVRVALYAFEPAQSFAASRAALGVARLVAGEEGGGRAALRDSARLGSNEAALILAWRLATSAQPSSAEIAEAISLAESAVASLPEAAAHRRVLAACYAAARRWPEAQAAVLRAIDLAQDAGDGRAVAELERDFARYRDFLPPGDPETSSGR